MGDGGPGRYANTWEILVGGTPSIGQSGVSTPPRETNEREGPKNQGIGRKRKHPERKDVAIRQKSAKTPKRPRKDEEKTHPGTKGQAEW